MVETLHSVEFPNGFFDVMVSGAGGILLEWDGDCGPFRMNRAEVQDLVTVLSDWLKGEFDD